MDEAYGHHHHHKRQARGQAAHPTWAVRGSERVNGLRRPKVTFNASFASPSFGSTSILHHSKPVPLALYQVSWQPFRKCQRRPPPSPKGVSFKSSGIQTHYYDAHNSMCSHQQHSVCSQWHNLSVPSTTHFSVQSVAQLSAV